jgi:hypothetical protein
MAELPAAFSRQYRLTWACPKTKQAFNAVGSFQDVMGYAAALLIDGCLALSIEDETIAQENDLDEAEKLTLTVSVPAHLAKFCGG